MRVKQILIILPLGLVALLAQSVLWVPTYEHQANANPRRLTQYIHASLGDAQILNPILHADTASGQIVNLVFDGLLDLDDQLRYRPRLARSWTQYELAYLVFNPRFQAPGLTSPRDWARWIQETLGREPGWRKQVESVTLLPPETVTGTLAVPEVDAEGRPVLLNGRPRMRALDYRLRRPARLKFRLRRIDQKFFEPIERLLGAEYFDEFDYPAHIQALNPADQAVLAPHYRSLLPLKEHNPVIEFELRRGVLFHDGHELDSGDVLFTYNAIMEDRNLSPRRSDYEPVKTAEVLGPYRIRFTYKRLFSPAVGAWTIGILPEHLLNREALLREARSLGKTEEEAARFTLRDSGFNRHPVGTGPFRFVEWQSDELIRLRRHEDYWEGPAEYREYVMRIIPDTLTQEMEFYAGAVDNYSVQPHQVRRLKSDPRFQSFSTVGFNYSYIGYNLRKPLFASREVRRALGMAIDVRQIIRYVLYNQGERVTGPYPKITDWYDPEVEPLPYDPEAALRILNRLGWKKNPEGWLEKDGKVFEFNLITNNGNPTRKAILTVVQNQWRKIGIKCNTQLFEWAVFLKDFVNALKFDAVVLGWSMGIDPDLYQLWHSSQTGPGQLNFVGFRHPEADRLIIEIRQEYDHDRQVELARRLHRLIASEQPYTFLFVNKSTTLLDKRIVIVERGPDGRETYRKIYPVKGGNIRYYFTKWRKLDFVPDFEAG